MIQQQGNFSGYTSTAQRPIQDDQAMASGNERIERLTWTRVDALFILVTLFGCVALFSTPVLTSIGNELLIFVSVFAMLNPYSATLYLAASQTIPNAPGIPFTPAQLSGLGFAIALIFNNRLTSLPIAFGQVIKWGGAFFFVMAVKRVIFEGSIPFTIDDLTMIAAAIMIATYYREIASNRWLWITCLCIGATIAIYGLVLNYLGLAAVISQAIGDIRDRTYVGRTYDSNNIGMVAGAAGLLTLWLLLGGKFLKTHHVTLLRLYLLVSIILTLISIIVSGSKGAIISATIMFVLMILIIIFAPSREMKTIDRSSLLSSMLLLIVIVVGSLFLPIPGLQAAIQNLYSFEITREEQTGTPWYIAGRQDEWGPVYEDFLNSSIILGTMPGQKLQAPTTIAHNVFLGVASSFGLLGLGAFAYLFFSPTFRLYKRNGLRHTLPFIFILFGIFFVFNYNPFINYKTFWVFDGGVIGLLTYERFGDSSPTTRRYEIRW